ncbi:MAG TPA: hypothetical protein VLR45_01895, partial [Desulfoprunum sp.]|nr:hypothetical protein [Desulfoprunum sp.]
MNPYDQHALEEAVRLVEAHGGEVTVHGLHAGGPAQRLRPHTAGDGARRWLQYHVGRHPRGAIR